MSTTQAHPQSTERASRHQTPANFQSEPGTEGRDISSPDDQGQPIFVSKPAPSTNSSITAMSETSPSSPQQQSEEDDVRECWVCRADSTEDTPETSPWRDPCPCALVAHEECLLDWIASKENSKTNRPARLECPQCKSEIKLSRPRDYIVDAVRGIEHVAGRMVTPGALTVLFATVYNSSMAWGIHSVYTVFGERDGFRILRPLIANAVRPPVEVWVGEQDAARRLLAVWLDHMVHWRLYTGLPLITPVLILSRTTLADSILPVLPILFFATQTPSREPLEFIHWPPSASMTFALLPYIRAGYNKVYNNLFAQKEKEWLRQIQPRANEMAEEEVNADDLPNAAPGGDDEHFFEVRIDGNIWEEWDDGDAQGGGGNAGQQPAPAQPAPQGRVDAPVGGGNEVAAQPPAQPDVADGQLVQDQGPANAPARAPGERRLSFSPTSVAETVLGAILFPTIAGLSGEILKVLLPRAWTTPSLAVKKGLLHEKWGRSIVGGCLFVVCKDALMLYVRWRMAQIHRKRRVVNIDRTRLR